MTAPQPPRVEVTLAECPPGLFQTPEGHWGFKTEYAHKNEADGRYYPEAYVVESGEFFWGGASDHPSRAKLSVFPLDVEAIRHRTAAEAASRAEVERWRGAAKALAEREAEYRKAHDLHGDGSAIAGRAWNLMRRQGDRIRAALNASDGEAG